MLSRVAESIYWMNRQIERAEDVARAAETTLDLALEGTIDHGRLWNALVCTFGDEADFWARHGLADQDNVITFLAFDTLNPNSISACLQSARENARTIRDLISTPMWEEINKAHLFVRSAASGGAHLHNPREFLDEVKRASQLITGVTDATMSHGEAWHFARMGRLIERADKTSRVLDVEHYFHPTASGDAADPVQWSAVLESASALEMYRKKYGVVAPGGDGRREGGLHEPGRAAAGPAAVEARLRCDRRGAHGNRRTARLHRRLSDPAQPHERGDPRHVLRVATGRSRNVVVRTLRVRSTA